MDTDGQVPKADRGLDHESTPPPDSQHLIPNQDAGDSSLVTHKR